MPHRSLAPTQGSSIGRAITSLIILLALGLHGQILPAQDLTTWFSKAQQSKASKSATFVQAVEKYSHADYEGAELLFSAHLKEVDDPKDDELTFLYRGHCYLMLKKYPNALGDLNRANGSNDRQIRSFSFFYTARCYEFLKDSEKAIEFYGRFLFLAWENKGAAQQNNRTLALESRMTLYFNSNQYVLAFLDRRELSTYKKVQGKVEVKLDSIERSDPFYEIAGAVAFEYVPADKLKNVEPAWQNFYAGDHSKAIAALTANLMATKGKLDPNVLFCRGYLYLINKAYLQAVDDFSAVLRNQDIDENVRQLSYASKGFSEKQLSKFDSAIDSFTAFLLLTDSRGQVGIDREVILLLRSESFERQGLLTQAADDLAEYLKVRPGNQEVRTKYQSYVNSQATLAPVDIASKEALRKLAEQYQTEKRYALVIGNSNYAGAIGPLKNPGNDARDIASELEKCKFEVSMVIDATHRQIEIAATEFYKKLSTGPKGQTVGLFYYAGHGLQFEGENYMVPLDANISVPSDIQYACYPINKILGKMEFANARMNIVILDACRNSLITSGNRDINSVGLSQIKAAKGTYIAFATAPGSVSSDGTSRNGLYTEELLKAIRQPARPIEQVFKTVRQAVLEKSGGKQSTWDNSNIVGEFYFKFE